MRFNFIAIVLLLISIMSSISLAKINFRIIVLDENINIEEWQTSKNSLEIQFRRPTNIPSLKLSDLPIQAFDIQFNPFIYNTTISFKYNISSFNLAKNQLFEVVLIDRYDIYSESGRKRFNLLTEPTLNLTIKRKTNRVLIQILNSNLLDARIYYEGKALDKGRMSLLGDPNSDNIRNLRVEASKYKTWEANLYEGQLLKQKEFFILLIPEYQYRQFEKAVYLFQLGYFEEAELLFQDIRINLPDWGYGYYYLSLIHFLKNNELAEEDIINLDQALTFARYEKNYLLMAEIKYLLAKYYMKLGLFMKAKMEADEGNVYIKNELRLFKDGRFKFYFVDYDLDVNLDFISISAEIQNLQNQYVDGNLDDVKFNLNERLFEVSQRLKRLIWTDDGLIEMQQFEWEIRKLREILRNKN